MSTDSNLGWQKFTLFWGALLLALPFALKGSFDFAFPNELLAYRTHGPINLGEDAVVLVSVQNKGRAVLSDIQLAVPAPSLEKGGEVKVARGRPGRFVGWMPTAGDAERATVKERQIFIPISRLAPDEAINVLLIAKRFEAWNVVDVRAQTATTTGLEAEGTIQLADLSLHSFRGEFHEGAPYLLMIILALVAFVVLVSSVYELFFDSDQKKVERLQRQMNAIQEKIDRARFM